MKNNGKSDYSTHFVDKALNYINKHTDLNQPEQVKAFIANLQTTTGYKKNLCLAYNKYAKHYQIQWKMPLYIPEAKTIKIPTREKIQMLIAHASRTLSLKLTLSMETGLRPIELCNLKVKDIDLDQNRNNEPSIYQ
jgi:integrase